MPVWLRKFTIHKINEYYSEQNQSTNRTTTNKLLTPGIKTPDYTVKGKKTK